MTSDQPSEPNLQPQDRAVSTGRPAGGSALPTSAQETAPKSEVVLCQSCDWKFWVRPGTDLSFCPHCFQPALAFLEETPATGDVPSELTVPFSLPADGLEKAIRAFCQGIPFPPEDLQFDRLQLRLQRLFLPAWLVDVSVRARWWAEAGFNYRVVSHRDRFNDNTDSWVSERLTEGRVRWEPRLGNLQRTYPNIALPAIDLAGDLIARLYQPDTSAAQPFQPGDVTDAWLRIPNRPQEDAWPDAAPHLQANAAEECRLAAQADQLRGFRWQPAYTGRHWTRLLMPIYTTCYYDDDGQPCSVFIDGQSGEPVGRRRASQKRALRLSAGLTIAGAGLVFIGLLMAVAHKLAEWLLVSGVALSIIGLFVMLGALFPLAAVWHFNRRQSGPTNRILGVSQDDLIPDVHEERPK